MEYQLGFEGKDELRLASIVTFVQCTHCGPLYSHNKDDINKPVVDKVLSIDSLVRNRDIEL